MLVKVIALRKKNVKSNAIDGLVEYLAREELRRNGGDLKEAKKEDPLHGLIDYAARGDAIGGTGNMSGLGINDGIDRKLVADMMINTVDMGKARRGFESNPYYHYAIAWPPGEKPNEKQTREAVEHTLRAVGMAENQFLYVVHTDTDNYHVHVVANRVHPEKLILSGPPKRDYLALDKACREIELLQGWRHVHGPHAVVNGEVVRLTWAERKERGLIDEKRTERSDTPASRMKEKHTGVPSFSDWMAGKVAGKLVQVVEQGEGWQGLHQVLAEHGVTARLEGGGLVFATVADGHETATKASGVNYKLSLGRLQKEMGEFRAVRGNHPVAEGNTYAAHIDAVRRGAIVGRENPGETGGNTDMRIKRRVERALAREALLDRYKSEKAGGRESATARNAEMRQQHQEEMRQLRERFKAEKAGKMAELERQSGKALAKGLWALHRAKETEALQARHKAEIAALRTYNRMAWPEWLEVQAKNGDTAAMAALRGIRYQEQRKAAKSKGGFEGEDLSDEIKPAAGAKPMEQGGGGWGSITGALPAFDLANARYSIDEARGLIVYHDQAGNARLVDSGNRVELAAGKNDGDAMLAGMRLASQKFGGSLYITGDAEFRERAARTAARNGIRVADQDLQYVVAMERGGRGR